MSHLYLWAPWLAVGIVVAVLLVRGRASFDPRSITVEALVVCIAYAVYYVVRGLTEGEEATAIDNAETLIDIERALGVYWEPRMQEFVLDYHWLTVLSNWIYIWWHWPVIIVSAVWLFLFKPSVYRRYRDAFVISGAVGVVCFVLFPVAPPRIADPDIIDTIAVHSDVYRTYEAPAFVNQYAAFPSLHFAWNLLVSIALVIEARHWLLRSLGAVSPVVVLLAIVVTGNHFIIDAAAGAVLAILALIAMCRYTLIPRPATG